MPETQFKGRQAWSLENDRVRVTVVAGGGHIAEITDKATGVNPLWVPHWPSMEPSQWNPATHPQYGNDQESKLLAGILGHNLCMDFFGVPTEAEYAAGLPTHGEASIVDYQVRLIDDRIEQRAELAEAGLNLHRSIRLSPGSPVVLIEETVENQDGVDKPIAWQQHATLGAPFIERGITEFRLSATKSKVFEPDPWGDAGPLKPGAEFLWPNAPRKNGGVRKMDVYTDEPVSGALTAHLMDPTQDQSFFLAYSRSLHCLCGYVWSREDYPWMAIWEENHSRPHKPWERKEITRGMEFGTSPFPESRRQMIERNRLFDTPTYRWLGAKERQTITYCAFAQPADRLPTTVRWDGQFTLQLAG